MNFNCIILIYRSTYLLISSCVGKASHMSHVAWFFMKLLWKYFISDRFDLFYVFNLSWFNKAYKTYNKYIKALIKLLTYTPMLENIKNWMFSAGKLISSKLNTIEKLRRNEILIFLHIETSYQSICFAKFGFCIVFIRFIIQNENINLMS